MSPTSFVHDGKTVVDRVESVIVAGWTGRDRSAVQHHIDELAAIGVAPPSTTPLFYRVASALLGPAGCIEVVGSASSGEVEPLLVTREGRLWLGVASDHTDRALEAHSVAASKQACGKPCSTDVWALEEVIDRLDQLEMRSWIPDGKGWMLYQEGTLAMIRPLAELLQESPLAGTPVDSGAAMLCGTLPAIGGVRPADAFRFELLDPGTGRVLRHEYAIIALEDVS